MSLDMFPGDQAEAIETARTRSAPRLPATFGDTFAASWSHGVLFGQSVAGANARRAVIDDFLADVRQKHGVSLVTPTIDSAPSLDDINTAIAARPDMGVPPLTQQDVDSRAIAKSKEARAAYKAMQEREATGGGSAGLFLGEASAQLADPVNLVALPLGPAAGYGVLSTALLTGAIGMGTQGVIELAGTPYRDQVDPAYSGSGEQAQNILGAGVAPAIIGGGVKALANSWIRLKTGQWPQRPARSATPDRPESAPGDQPFDPEFRGYLDPEDAGALDRGVPQQTVRPIDDDLPGIGGDFDFNPLPRHLRDAGNVVESEAQIADSNPFKGVEGEVAHRQALGKAIDDLLEGRPVEVDEIVGDLVPERLNLPEPAVPEPQGKLDLPKPGEPRPAMLDEMAADLTAKRRQEIRSDPETDDAVALDLDRLRANKDVKYPSGETIDAQGQRTPVMRSIDDDIREIEARQSAADEIKLCASPPKEAAE